MGPHRSGIGRVLLVLGLLFATSCTAREGERPEPSERPIDPRLRGSILVAGGFRPGSTRGGLGVIDVRTDVDSPVQVPSTHFILAGAFRNDGSILGVVQDGRGTIRAYAMSVEQPAQPLSPPIPAGVFEFSFDLSVAGDVLLAADCDGGTHGYTLDLARPVAWRPVTASCLATLSPDGRRIAGSPDGRTIVTSPADRRGPAERVLDLADLDDLPQGVADDPEIVGSLAWGEAGLAAMVAGGSRLAVVIVALDGSITIVDIGDSAAGFRTSLAWEPGDASLAVASETHTESVVRSLDVSAGGGPVLGLSDEPISDLVWSPSGDVLLAATVFSWVYVDPEGGWLRKAPVNRSRGAPVAWAD
jgi:WD40 repeat protein